MTFTSFTDRAGSTSLRVSNVTFTLFAVERRTAEFHDPRAVTALNPGVK